MMAEIIEGTPVEPGEEDEVMDLLAEDFEGEVEQVEEPKNAEPTKAEEQDPEPASTIPDKFKGKSPEEIAASYVELEREFGRRSNELSDLRRVTDEILRKQLSPEDASDNEDEELSAQDFLDNPVEAVRKVMANDPERRREAEMRAQASQQVALDRFKADHPDANAIMQSAEFVNWLQKVPSRYQRFANADANLDWDTAGETIATYKEIYAVAHAEAQAEAEAEREGALRDVKNATPASKKEGGKRKVYRKADIFKLKETNPAKYEQLQPVILQAYREGRVID